MSLDINGYNSIFRSFVDFAQLNRNVDKGKAILDATPTLSGRKITAVTIDFAKNDSVHNWTRGFDQWTVNDRTRAIFKAAVANMFGGESKIPASVKKAMILSDYDCGKPLTARRILAVKAAIDADGTARVLGEKASLDKIGSETFKSPDVKQAALDMGYMKSELPKLARAAHFYAKAKDVSEMEALREVGRPGSEANRLMNYGGRFLLTASNFQDGLRLISLFSEWHDGLSAKNGPKDTPSKLNVDFRAGKPEAKLGLERFLFEDIATNPNFNLAEMDAERAFGVEHNPVSRFMTTASNTSTIGTLVSVPPEKRRVVCAAFNAFTTLATKAKPEKQLVSYETIFLARTIKNLPKLEAILAKTGTLTGRDVIKNCFPDILRPGNCDMKTIKAWEDQFNKDVMGHLNISMAIMQLTESTGATCAEAVDALERGEKLPTIPYYSDAQYSIEEASSVVAHGISTMNGDLGRCQIYKTNEGAVFPAESHSWKINFPDGERLETSGTKKADIPRVGEKIRQLCGEVHPKQIGTVAYMLSQSGLAALVQKPLLAKYGIDTNEHSPVDFTLSRNAETGAVTITYTSPEELPVKFSWTATVAIDGTVTSTPFTIVDPAA